RVRREGDVARHVENDVIANASHAHARGAKPLGEFGLLLVHVVADAAACQRAHTRTNKRALTAVLGIALADQPACQRAADRANQRAISSRACLLLARIGVLRRAGGKAETCANCQHREFLHQHVLLRLMLPDQIARDGTRVPRLWFRHSMVYEDPIPQWSVQSLAKAAPGENGIPDKKANWPGAAQNQGRAGRKKGRFAMSLFDLTGKVAIVTGSTRGIGEAIVHRMVEHGAKVV